MIKNYYQILEIKPDTTTEGVKKAFRKKALKYHPDVCKLSNANDLFIEIYEAFEILYDENKRKIYDQIYLKNEGLVENKRTTNDDISNVWMKNAKAKAENHSKMKYKQYKTSGLNEFLETTRETLSWGCLIGLIIFGFLGLYGFFVGLSQYLRHERDDTTFIIGLFMFMIPAVPFIYMLILREKDE